VGQVLQAAAGRDPDLEGVLRGAREACRRDVRYLDGALARLFERLDADRAW
jgi:hypothetical protein